MTRPVRVLMVANDGFSAGHVARTVAIARGLRRAAARRQIALATVLATTSQAHALQGGEPLAIVTLPAPAAARQAGLSDAERRRLVRTTLAGAIDGFGPDLIVVDTFPSGPHGELVGLEHRTRRALIRRSVPILTSGPRRAAAVWSGNGDNDLVGTACVRDAAAVGDRGGLHGAATAGDRGGVHGAGALDDHARVHGAATAGDRADARNMSAGCGATGVRGAAADALSAGLAEYDLAILAGDPEPLDAALPISTRHVPPITLVEARDVLDRAAARAALGLPGGRAILVTAGGGGDLDAAARAMAIAQAVLRVAPDATPVVALGPLAAECAAPDMRIRVLHCAPLAPLLAAFDGAFAAAGYNTAHELARARVPAALFAQPRPFDDQAARAARFARAGFACALASTADEAITDALAWMATARIPELEAGGADRAADALLDLVTGGRR